MRRLRRELMLVPALVASLAAAPAVATVTVIQPSSQDAYIQKDKPNRITGAGPTHTRIRVMASPPDTKTRRGLVQFDLSAIPAGSVVNSAVLEIHEGNNPGSPVTHGVHRVLAPWLQSSVKWSTQPPHAAAPTATALVPADTVREFRAFDVTADVASFVTLCTADHGWMVRDQNETGSSEEVNYHSREDTSPADIGKRPRLTVDFTPPPCTTNADCADGNACTLNERCEAGACVVDVRSCDDGNPCTDDTCDCAAGCINAPICNDGFDCTLDTCNPATLACSNTVIAGFCNTDCATGTCVADPDRTDIDPATGCLITSVSPPGTTCDDGDPCTRSDQCDGAGQCEGEALVCDHYVAYKATRAKLAALPDENKFPGGWNVTLDDAQLDDAPPELFPDDPENYAVVKERGIVNPAMKNAEPGPFLPDLHYLRYQIKEAGQGVGPETSPGVFPKPVKAPKRIWEVTNQLGNLFIETKKPTTLWVPAGKAEAPGVPADPGDATHFVCYKAKAAKIPSAQAPDAGNGKAKFRKDLQHYFRDQFDDCQVLKDGVTVPFQGTPVEGKCLYDLKKPKELCNPVDKRAVEPPRVTAAVITESTATVREQSLLCYQAKLTSKVRSGDAAALGGLQVGGVVKQRKHVKRTLKTGTQVNTFPGNGFPRPLAVDTTKQELVCVPTEVLSVGDL